jgi:hypothetical protein
MPGGQERVLKRFIRACAARDGSPDDLPIVVLWGSRGAEHSELLQHLDQIDNWKAPRAFLDGEELRADLRPHQVASRLAFQMGRRVALFGRARFPRFFLGLWAVRNPLDPDDAAGAREARRELIRRQLRNTSEGRDWVRRTAETVAGLAGADKAVSNAVGLAVDGIIEISRTIALLRGTGMRWYRDGLGRRFPDPVDALVELSVWESQGHHAWVDEALCRAFVDDVRGEFDGGITVYARKTCALVLLDNAGMPAVGRFVDVLSKQPGGSGPLLVVAASHLRFPQSAAAEPAQWQPDGLADASLDSWSDRRRERNESRYYPVWVDPVDEVPATAEPDRPAVEELVRRLSYGPVQRPTVAFAHRLTAAHPAGLEMVVDTLRGVGALPGSAANAHQADLRSVFRLEYAAGAALDDAVFGLVLDPWTDGIGRGLVLMAMAVDLSEAHVDPIRRHVTPPCWDLSMDFRMRDLWVTHPVRDGVPEPPRLHPFVRRAIAHRLARPGGIERLEMNWNHAHELLRNTADPDDLETRLYHDLALANVQRVADQLAEKFDLLHPRPWYELLTKVTAAPLAHPDRGANPSAHFAQLCADGQPTRRLIAALQLHADPLGDPHHDTCLIVAGELGQLAQQTDRGAAFLHAESRNFIRCWNSWHPGRN